MPRARLRDRGSSASTIDASAGPVARRILAGRPIVAVGVATSRLLRWALRSVVLTGIRAWLGLFPRARPRRVRSAVRSLPDDPTILFLCPGNRSRSPVAERFARAELDRRSIGDVEVESGSIVPVDDRAAPTFAAAAARRFSVDLQAHDPSVVTREQLERSDLILVMDGRDYLRLAVFGTTALWKTYLLGSLVDSGRGCEITATRPGAKEREYWQTFAAVTDAVDGLVDHLEERDHGGSTGTAGSIPFSSRRERETARR